MASYPSSLPVTDPAGANLSTNPHSTLHDDMYDEIVAIATELGTLPKGTSASVKARLDFMTPGAWTAVTFQNSWTDTGGSNQVTQYRKAGDIVTVRLSCSTGASNTVAFTLPSGYRPPETHRRTLDGAGGYAYAIIATTGTVTLVGTASIQGEFSFSVTA